ncbi:MAG: creatininase family protein [Pirellulales bacterium]|nr:creatininase family protein [Pirellulales bacterium]
MSAALPEVVLGKLTRREFRERMQRGELRACIIPTGAIEQHLEHLAMEHDWRSVTHVAAAAARRLAPSTLVAGGLMAGISEHHMRHPGTLSLRPGTFLAVLTDMIDSMHRAGFEHILVLNGHGGNNAPVRGCWSQLQQLAGINLHFLPYWETISDDEARLHLQTGILPGHAQEFETSVALAEFPENVRKAIWTDQADPSPALATAAAGQVLFELIVARVADYVRDMIEGRRTADIPPFFP